MIAQTSAFLTWALAANRDVPRIPTRRVDRGGFADLTADARAAASRWWSQTFDRIADWS